VCPVDEAGEEGGCGVSGVLACEAVRMRRRRENSVNNDEEELWDDDAEDGLTPVGREVQDRIERARNADPTMNIDMTAAAADALLAAKGRDRFNVARSLARGSEEDLSNLLILLALKVDHGRDARF
jgi:hypothetical protein